MLNTVWRINELGVDILGRFAVRLINSSSVSGFCSLLIIIGWRDFNGLDHGEIFLDLSLKIRNNLIQLYQEIN
jgi:hypothetical protein